MRPTPRADTAARILDVAERLVQIQGWNGFSYADISAELHITKASLHHHFASKVDLGKALIGRYREGFCQALDRIYAANGTTRSMLKDYAQLYTNVLRKDRMCLCGMLAADFETLPKAMRRGVTDFFDANEAWLVKVLEHGRKTNELAFEGSAADMAKFLVSSLEGAMLVARTFGDVSRFESVVAKLLDALERSA
jgi:TetR/AcrR family transcriptional repressor of nem operon